MAKKIEPTAHRVLYIQRSPRADFVPLMSRDLSDAEAGEEFAAVRVEEINKARHAGAVRPKFRVVVERDGEEQQEVSHADE